MTLHISMQIPSSALNKSAIDRAVTALASRVALERRQRRLPEGPALDITFMLSSADAAPPFSGMRMGGYTPQSKTLFFETAVPARLSDSEEAPRYVATVLEDVIRNAGEYFREYGIDFDSGQWRDFIGHVTGADATSGTTLQ